MPGKPRGGCRLPELGGSAVRATMPALACHGTQECPAAPPYPGRPQKKHLGFQNNGEKGVVVYLPPGRFKVTQTLEISQSNVVLRGAGVSSRDPCDAAQWQGG